MLASIICQKLHMPREQAVKHSKSKKARKFWSCDTDTVDVDETLAGVVTQSANSTDPACICCTCSKVLVAATLLRDAESGNLQKGTQMMDTMVNGKTKASKGKHCW